MSNQIIASNNAGNNSASIIKDAIQSIINALAIAQQGNCTIYDFNDEQLKATGLDIDAIASDLVSHNMNPLVLSEAYEKSLTKTEREKRGAFYTPAHLTHKMIDPLFIIRLESELADCRLEQDTDKRINALNEFRNKLSTISILDPAAGAGNILCETYKTLRLLDIRAMVMLHRAGVDANEPAVNMSQFYGIEIDQESANMAQILMSTCELVLTHIQNRMLGTTIIPSDSRKFTIVVGDSLELDWHEVMELSAYPLVIGNPPFIGWQKLTDYQKEQCSQLAGTKVTGMDYAGAWFYKAAAYLTDEEGNHVGRFAFISNANIAFGSQKYTTLPVIAERGWHHCLSCPPTAWKSKSSTVSTRVMITGYDSDPDCITYAEPEDVIDPNYQPLNKSTLVNASTLVKNPTYMNFAGYVNEPNYETKPSSRKLSADLAELEASIDPGALGRLVIINAAPENRYWFNPYYSNEKVSEHFNHFCIDSNGLTFSITSTRAFQLWRFMTCSRSRGDATITKTLTWNTFPLRTLTGDEKQQLINCTRKILAIRNQHKDDYKTPLGIYHPDRMPAELKQAHERLDSVMNTIFGVSANATDKELRKAMYEQYQLMASSAGKQTSVQVNKPASTLASKPVVVSEPEVSQPPVIDDEPTAVVDEPAPVDAEPLALDSDELERLILSGDEEALKAYQKKLYEHEYEQEYESCENRILEARRKADELRKQIRKQARMDAMRDVRLAHSKKIFSDERNAVNGKDGGMKKRFNRPLN